MGCYLTEVCVDSLESAVIAERAGANRLELVSAIRLGGLTPSTGLLKSVLKSVEIPVFAMIRPRMGGFCYSDYDFMTMKQEIIELFDAGCQGFVFGVLNEKGEADIKRLEELVFLCHDRKKVFHRAFDLTPDLFKCCEELIDLGFDRILTKGGYNKLEDGKENVNRLIDKYSSHIEIISGGVREENVSWIKENMKLNQVHISSNMKRIDNSTINNRDLYFGTEKEDEGIYFVADEEYLRRVINKFNS